MNMANYQNWIELVYTIFYCEKSKTYDAENSIEHLNSTDGILWHGAPNKFAKCFIRDNNK